MPVEIDANVVPNNNDNANLQPTSLTKLVEEIRKDGKVKHEELNRLMRAYEDRRTEIKEGMNEAFMKEKHIADQLFAESFDDMFEEYEIRGAEDMGRIERLLSIVNPIRLADGKPAVFLTQEVKDYYKETGNEKSKQDIRLNTETGQLEMLPFWKKWTVNLFTKEGVATVKKEIETLSQDILKKMEKMLQSSNNLMRGSIDDFRAWLTGIFEKDTPESKSLKELNKTKVATLGDFHLGQLEAINGVVRITDIDESRKNNSPLIDLIRVISSIQATSGPDGDKNVEEFLNTLKARLGGKTVPNDTSVSMKPKTTETQADILNLSFIKATPEGRFDTKVTRVSIEEQKEIETILKKSVIDSRIDLSDGVGSYGKRKILVTVKESDVVKVYELKEQDREFSDDRYFSKHSDQERADVSDILNGKGIIKAVKLGGKPYTMKEIVPGYQEYKPDKGDREDRTWASRAAAIELAKLWSVDPETQKKILGELSKTNVSDALKKLGTEYADRMNNGLKKGKEEYPELIERSLLEKNKKFLNENKGAYSEIMTGLEDKKGEELITNMKSIQIYIGANNGMETKKAINKIHELINTYLDLKDKNALSTSKGEFDKKTLENLRIIATKPQEVKVETVETKQIPLSEKYSGQIKILEKFYKENPDYKKNFIDTLLKPKNKSAYFALAEILRVSARQDGYTHAEDIQSATEKIQKDIQGLKVDKAFGPDTLKMWKESDKYGKKKVDVPLQK